MCEDHVSVPGEIQQVIHTTSSQSANQRPNARHRPPAHDADSDKPCMRDRLIRVGLHAVVRCVSRSRLGPSPLSSTAENLHLTRINSRFH